MNAWYDSVREPLIARRKHLGMTQEDVADEMGVTGTIVSRLESGRRHGGVLTSDPRVSLICRWAAALGMTITFMVDDAR